jgi:hypothetical protein
MIASASSVLPKQLRLALLSLTGSDPRPAKKIYFPVSEMPESPYLVHLKLQD